MKASRTTLHYFLAVPMALAIREAPVRRTPGATPAPAGLPAPAGQSSVWG